MAARGRRSGARSSPRCLPRDRCRALPGRRRPRGIVGLGAGHRALRARAAAPVPGTQCRARTGRRARLSLLSRPTAGSRDSGTALRPASIAPRPAPAQRSPGCAPAPQRTHGHSRRAAASPARTDGPGRRRSGDITQGSSASAALPLPFPGGARGRARSRARSDALPARPARSAARVAAAAPSCRPSPIPFPPSPHCPRRHGPDAAVPALRARRALRAGGQRQGRRGLRGAARRAGPLRGRAGLRARVRVGHKERREGGTRGDAVPRQGWGEGLLGRLRRRDLCYCAAFGKKRDLHSIPVSWEGWARCEVWLWNGSAGLAASWPKVLVSSTSPSWRIVHRVLVVQNILQYWMFTRKSC